MTRTLSTLIAIISLLCLASCNNDDDDDYRIAQIYETGRWTHPVPPDTVINTQNDLYNYLQKYEIKKEHSIYKELDVNFSGYSIIAFSHPSDLEIQKIEYAEANKSITVYCHTLAGPTTPRPFCFFIKVKPQIPSRTKVNVDVNNR